jgi:hypothetical protein
MKPLTRVLRARHAPQHVLLALSLWYAPQQEIEHVKIVNQETIPMTANHVNSVQLDIVNPPKIQVYVCLVPMGKRTMIIALTVKTVPQESMLFRLNLVKPTFVVIVQQVNTKMIQVKQHVQRV